jgi:ribosome-associated protein
VKTPRKRATKKFPAQVQRAIDAGHDRKAGDVVVLDLRPADGFTDYFVIMTGQNTRQLQAISESIQESLTTKGVKPAHIEGGDKAGWILLDYFDFIVHIFSPESRSFYALERLWGSADRIAVADPAPPHPPQTHSRD